MEAVMGRPAHRGRVHPHAPGKSAPPRRTRARAYPSARAAVRRPGPRRRHRKLAMLMILLGIVAAIIGGAGVVSRHEPVDRPKGQVEMPENLLGGGSYTQAVTVEPYSELKYKHIVHQ